jgi:serine/threonine protein phosphatase PrpC
MTGHFPIPPHYDLPSMQRIQTAWQKPWLLLACGQQGERHFDAGEPCEDNHLMGGAGDVSWMVLADGVSSATRSRFGSSDACHAVNQFLGRAITGGERPRRELLVRAIGYAHTVLKDRAQRERTDIDEYATTLAIGLMHGNRLLAAAIGDSSIAIATDAVGYNRARQRTFSSFCTAKPSGRIDQTWSLTNPNWMDTVATAETDNPIVSMFLLATDGGHNFFLNPSEDGHTFDPAYPEFLLDNLGNGKLGPLLIGNVFGVFLKKVKAENRDDRTILIAARVSDDFRPSAA